jgi:hypothetical protein
MSALPPKAIPLREDRGRPPQGHPTARLVEKRDPRRLAYTLKIARKFLMLFVRFSARFEKNC